MLFICLIINSWIRWAWTLVLNVGLSCSDGPHMPGSHSLSFNVIGPDAYEPIFGARIYEAQEYIDAEMWAYGYMRGVELCREQWQPIFDDPNGSVALRPIRLHTAGDVTPEEELLIKTPIQREELAKQIPASVAWIYRYWLPYRQATFERSVATTFQREHPKIGRNDPCLCGSGKKYKKCCGIAMTLH